MKRKSGILSRRKESLTHNSIKETGCLQTKPNRQKKQEKLIQMNSNYTFYFDENDVCCYRLKKEATMKKGDILQVWDDKNYICLGWGEVIGIGVSSKKGIPLIDTGSKLIWGNDYFCIPEKRALQITRRIEKDLEKVLLRNRN
ncbi:hypothetical protein ES702_03814 [subsurface metagenome]